MWALKRSCIYIYKGELTHGKAIHVVVFYTLQSFIKPDNVTQRLFQSLFLGLTHPANQIRDPPQHHIISLQDSASMPPLLRSPRESFNGASLFHYEAAWYDDISPSILLPNPDTQCDVAALKSTFPRGCWFPSSLEEVKLALLIFSHVFFLLLEEDTQVLRDGKPTLSLFKI